MFFNILPLSLYLHLSALSFIFLSFTHIRSSSRRVAHEVFSIPTRTVCFRHRDLYFLRQVLIIYAIFLCGWLPITIIAMVDYKHPFVHWYKLVYKSWLR